jgi:REP element-mobilizing transposase RayT
MPDHVHILIRKHRLKAEAMISAFQEHSRTSLIEAGHRAGDHPVWGGPGWKVFLDAPSAVHRVVKYIEDNPIKLGLPSQPWPFVLPYDNWPQHQKRRGT